MKNYLLFICLGLSLSLIFSSCGDKEGCTDPLSENYNANATVDDGSCTYLTTDLTENIDQPTTLVGIVTVCGSIKINSDLTISEGTILNFCPDASLVVEVGGSLSAIGTQDKRIVFQGEQATKGFWSGIHIRSNNPSNVMDFVDVNHAGSYWGWSYAKYT